MKRIIAIACLLSALHAKSQGTNMEFEKFDISPGAYAFLHADIDIIPGQDRYVVSAQQSFPFYEVDGKNHELVGVHDVGNWYAGSRLSVSSQGKYVLLQQLYYIDFLPNKDREVQFQVLDLETGSSVLKISAAHDAEFHPNEKELIVLEGDDVYSYPLSGAGKKRLFPVPAATNCLAISPDGKQIAISHYPEDDFLNDFVTKKKQKKNFKLYKKYRQCVSVYSTDNFEKLYTVDDMFDIPYVLQYGPRGEYLICYSVPHTKVVAKTGMQGTNYISKIDASNGHSLPNVGFVSNSIYEPDIEFSHNKDYIGLVTINTRFPEVWVCNFNNGKIVARFELAQRLFEGMKKGEFPADAGRVGIAFSPDDEHMYITNGSLIYKWKIPY